MRPIKYNVNRFLCLFLFLFTGHTVMAQEVYLQYIAGKIKAGDSCRTTDPVYLSNDAWAKREKDFAINNIISFELRQDTGVYYYGKPFQCSVNIDIEYEDEQRAQHTLAGKVLTVTFDTTTGGIYKGVAMYKFTGGYNVKVVVNSISSPQLGGQDSLPAAFRVKNEVFVERKFLFSTANTDVTRYNFLSANKQLLLNWVTNYDYPGAELYDLEWTFYDDSSEIARNIRASYTQTQIENGEVILTQPVLEGLFQNNSTRITTKDRQYVLNNPYPGGFLFYRVRGARINGFTDEREEGEWTYKAYSPGNNTVSAVVYVPGHETKLNYQYTATFAESGKRKEIISYFDGSMRQRQAVTISNSDNKSIVQEAVFDVMGRPSLNILPSPEMDSTLHYFQGINRNQSGNIYSYVDLTNDTATCVLAPQPLINTSGASRYYSSNNQFTETFFNKYIPDAEGYPFSTTAYTQDNTGRVSRSGGIGLALQPGSGHEIRYFYGKPSQVELDRLFGSEAGNAQHFLKNMILDANGQINITYVDAQGHTIASSLAGRKPDNVYDLPSAIASGAITRVESELATRENTTRNPAAYSVTSNSTMLIAMNGSYNFHYAYDPATVLTSSCESAAQQICGDCYYDLYITIKDECGTIIKEIIKPAVLTGLDTSCSTKPPVVEGTFSLALVIGEYQVEYELRSSREAAAFYEEAYMRQNTCIKTLDDFKRQQLAETDFTGCFTDCATCKETLGTKESFMGRFINMIKAEDMIPDQADSLTAGNLFDSLYASCNSRCATITYESSCDDTYQLLLADATPGGQYALFNNDALEDTSLTILLEEEINILAKYNLVSNYKDADGNPALVEREDGTMVAPQNLSLREFIANFRPSWAPSLVQYHPEYCFYKWCSLINPSKQFDEMIRNYSDDVEMAADSGWWNPGNPLALLDKDPFFADPNTGQSFYNEMKGVLQNFSGTIQANPQGGTANILQVVRFLVYCVQDTTLESYADCQEPSNCNVLDRPLEWLLYKNLYLQTKAKYVEKARLVNSDPTIRNCKNCYIGYAVATSPDPADPDSSTYQQYGEAIKICPDFYSDARKLLYSNKVRQFLDEISTESLMVKYTSSTMEHLRDSLDLQLAQRLDAACQSNCESQANDWMQSLQYCNNLVNGTDSTKYFELRQALINVCKGGCDVSHPFGSGTIAPGSSNIDSSFEAAISRVLGPGALSDSCTALLIHSPQPYANPSALAQTAVDSCTCEKLQGLKLEFEQRGGKGSFLSFLKFKFGNGFYLTQSELDILLKRCTPGECVAPSLLPVAIPDALSCNTCASCDSVSALVNTFKVAHPALSDTSRIFETLLTNYLNQNLRFTLTFPEYWKFFQQCANRNEDEYAYIPVPCVDFTKAYTDFTRFQPDYYADPNGDTSITTRYKQHVTTWLNIALNRHLSFDAYEDAAQKCGISIPVPGDSLPIVCGVPLTIGDSVYANAPSVMDCCSMGGYIQRFQQAFPEGVNARLVAYYFEMRRQEWGAPIGMPNIDYRQPYDSLKNYFVQKLKFPRSVIIDITETGTNYQFNDSLGCGLDYNFGAVAPWLDDQAFRLCNHSLVVPVEIDSLNCFKAQFNMALINGGVLHQQYMDSVRNEYEEIYLSRCLSVQPVMTMEGDLYEYHYTLFYYDQSGNLVKTVPPAGVHFLSDTQLGQVRQDRPYGSPECYTYADELYFNGQGNIPMMDLLNRQNGRPYTVEFWIRPDNTTGQPLFSEETKISSPSRFIDSTRTIPAFNGTKGISSYINNGLLNFRIGSKPWYLPDTLFLTQTGQSSIPVSGILSSGKWVHVVMSSTGVMNQPFKVYVNGQAIPFSFASQVDTLGSAPVAESTPAFLLGSSVINNNWTNYKGYVRQFRFYNRAIRYTEVVLNRDDSCRLPSNEGGLLIWAPMNEGRDETQVYDRMQNIALQTSFPAGFSWLRFHDPLYPVHTMVNTYQHNSLNNVRQQYMPDMDTSRFWYDKLGRIFASQNAEQRNPLNGGLANRYNYRIYDQQGRIVETGEKTGADLDVVNVFNDEDVQEWLSAGTNKQITKTQYDEQLAGVDLPQGNLRKRIATVSVDDDGDGTYEMASHYNYDILGNVKTLWQEIAALKAVDSAQGIKRIDYEYDLAGGRVNRTIYQQGKKDQFLYRYLYDANSRVIQSASSQDGLVWQRDASYRYYLHGPLARMEFGEYKVQGLDFAYTLQGWVKGMNAAMLNVEKDMAGDGKEGSNFERFGKDVIGFTIGYYQDDYKSAGGVTAAGFNNNYVYPALLGNGNGMYNGNISNISLALNMFDSGDPKGYTYSYDQLNRMVQMRQNNISSTWLPVDNYKESVSYDANGNILSYLRNGAGTLAMDKLKYIYASNTNRLLQVKDSVAGGNYTMDIDDQPLNNYTYDNAGNLMKDSAEGIRHIDWTVYGKIRSITKDALNIEYAYDAGGNRISKEVDGEKYFYLRDAVGNVMGMYSIKNGNIQWEEQHLYGNGRLGIWRPSINMQSAVDEVEKDSLMRGLRTYEVPNHLGNIMATLSDKKTGISSDTQHVDYFSADVLSQNDYYPFGMQMPGRSYAQEKYRYGFNGKENDNEVKGDGNQQDYGMRIYDPRIGRFLSVDPLASEYAELTPYQFASNRPIDGIDVDGKEWANAVTLEYFVGTGDHLRVVTTNVVKLKVVNKSTIITSPNVIKAKAELVARSIENKYTNFHPPMQVPDEVIRTEVILDYTPESPDDGAIGILKFDDRKSKTTQVVMKGLNGTTFTRSVTSKTSGDASGGIMYFTLSIGITMDGQVVPDKDLIETSEHETGHTAGLNHPWKLSAEEKAAFPELDQNGAAADKAVIRNNLLNSAENPDPLFNHNSGPQLLPKQLDYIIKNIRKLSTYKVEDLRPKPTK